MEHKKHKTTKCEECGYNVRNNAVAKHKNSKSCNRNKNKSQANFLILENGDCKCNECGFISSKIGIKSHYWLKHTEEGKNKTSGFSSLKGKPSWKKGLTKNDHESIKRTSEKNSISRKGKQGKKLSQEAKDKMSLTRKEYFKNNPDKVLYKLFDRGESYPEKVFREYLEKNDIKGWVQEFQFKQYSFDFAFPEYKLDVEIDGKTHLDEKVIEKDRIRDEKAKSEGWKVIRITAKEVADNVYECVNRVLAQLGEKQIEVPEEFLHAKMLKHLKQVEKEQKKTSIVEKEKSDLIKAIDSIDLTKRNWASEVGKLLNRTPGYIKKITKKYLPEVFEKTTKVKSFGLGLKNSQYGTCWITKEGLNKKIDKSQLDLHLIKGWIKGRII